MPRSTGPRRSSSIPPPIPTPSSRSVTPPPPFHHRPFSSTPQHSPPRPRRECPGFDVRQGNGTQGLMDRVAAGVKALGLTSLGVEGASITVKQFASMTKALEGVELRPTEEIVERLRRVKDECEIAPIR